MPGSLGNQVKVRLGRTFNAKNKENLNLFTRQQSLLSKEKKESQKKFTSKYLSSSAKMKHRTFFYYPDGSDGKESTCNVGDLGLIPEWERSPGEGNGNPLQYSCLENPTDGGAWWATVHGVTKSWTWLSDFSFTFFTFMVTAAMKLKDACSLEWKLRQT